MGNMSKLLTAVGLGLILLVIVLKLGNTHLVAGRIVIRLISLLVVANISFTLAILFKK